MTERIEGQLPVDHPLSPEHAFSELGRMAQALVRYPQATLWEADTATLARPLARFRRRVRDFARAELAPRALAADTAAHPSTGELSVPAREVLSLAARAGLLSDLLPRPFGAQDPTLLAHPLALPQALKTEELAAVDGGLMLLICATGLGVAPILLGGVGAIRRFVLPGYARCHAGEPHVFAYAITEPAGGSDVEDGHGATTYVPGAVARRVPGGYRLSGRKLYISGGDIAQTTVVFAALEGAGMESWTAFVVPSSTAGFSVVRTELKMGMRASGAAELLLEDAFVPSENLLVGERRGWALNRAVLNMSRLPVAAMGVGFARAALELALDFCCNYRLGRRRLIDYQDVQLQLATMAAETQAARAMVWAAARRKQAVQREASAAKQHATDTALKNCTRAMDLLGNHAVRHDALVEKAYRDARLTQIFEGTNEINRLAVIEDLQHELSARSSPAWLGKPSP